jgi:hypothetical protein
VSFLPREVRDQALRKLERAVEERDRTLSRLEGSVESLRAEIGRTEGDLQRQQALLDRLDRELRQADRELDRERDQAMQRLEQLRQRAERQHQELQAALMEAERRHRQEWEELQGQIRQLAQTREDRERRTWQAAGESLERAGTALAGLDREEMERLDLRGNLTAAELQLASAQAAAAGGQTPAAELLTAAHGAEEAVLLVRSTAESRQAILASLREDFAGEVAWLEALLQGDAVLGLPDQTEEMRLLLAPERETMQALITRQLSTAAGGLRRWNGHGALLARLSGVRDLLAAELLAARKTLPAGVAHDRVRYALGHIWDDLELRFGSIRYRGADTPGVWAEESDRKSTYFYFLESEHGELRVEVPWTADILVHHEGRTVQRHLPAQPPDDAALALGGLQRRWSQLASRLDNPNWNPDWQQPGGAP